MEIKEGWREYGIEGEDERRERGRREGGWVRREGGRKKIKDGEWVARRRKGRIINGK